MSFDYCLIGDKGDIVTQIEADEEPGSIKVLVVRDNRSKTVFAHTVPVKGADEGGVAVKAITNCNSLTLNQYPSSANAVRKAFNTSATCNDSGCDLLVWMSYHLPKTT